MEICFGSSSSYQSQFGSGSGSENTSLLMLLISATTGANSLSNLARGGQRTSLSSTGR